MPRAAFLSIENTDGWFIDDDLVHEPLRKAGWEIENIPWNHPADWNRFDLVIIRSPWDYQDHPDHFMNVLKAIEDSSAVLANNLEIVRWNIHKDYLFELQEKGVELLPTRKIYSPGLSDINETFAALNATELIIKPVIGANADDTFRLKKGLPDTYHHILQQFRERECYLQAFEENILNEGEFAVMYFNGKRAHTVLKTVKKGDFRVQEEHGGGVLAIPNPEKELLSAADRAMDAVPFIPLYARVDLVRTKDNSFALMELELIEPCLYFRFDSSAPHDFAQAIDAFWKRIN